MVKSCNCDVDSEKTFISMHTCTNIFISINFKYKETNQTLWVQVPFDYKLFYNDPKSAGKFIDKLAEITKKEILEIIYEDRS